MRRQKIFRHWSTTKRRCWWSFVTSSDEMETDTVGSTFNRWTWAVVRLKFDYDAIWHLCLTAINQIQCVNAYARNKSLKFHSTVLIRTCTRKCVSSTESITLAGVALGEMGQARRNWYLFCWKWLKRKKIEYRRIYSCNFLSSNSYSEKDNDWRFNPEYFVVIVFSRYWRGISTGFSGRTSVGRFRWTMVNFGAAGTQIFSTQYRIFRIVRLAATRKFHCVSSPPVSRCHCHQMIMNQSVYDMEFEN